MTNFKISFDEYIPLRDLVFKSLREAIITGELKPGERLMEIKLASELGVSRTPVREAIKKLEYEGLVIINARKGAEVAPINEKDLRDVLEIRKSLESLACELACKHVNEENIARIRECNSELEKAVASDDIEKIAEMDVKLHEVIFEMTNNKRLVRMLHRLKEHIFRYRLEYIKEMKNKNLLVEEHNKIAKYLEQKNAKMASKEMEKHIEGQEKYILNSLLQSQK